MSKAWLTVYGEVFRKFWLKAFWTMALFIPFGFVMIALQFLGLVGAELSWRKAAISSGSVLLGGLILAAFLATWFCILATAFVHFSRARAQPPPNLS